MKKIILVALVILLITANFKKSAATKSINKPDRDYVPDQQTAIKVAEVVLSPILESSLDDSKPFTAHLTSNIWVVKGKTPPPGVFGGVVEIKIRKTDCKIMGLIISK